MQTSVMIFGLGYIGRMVLEALQEETPFWNRTLKIVGAVDVVMESRQWAEKKGVPAYASLSDLLQKQKPDVCIHTTASGLASIVPQLKELIEAKIPVVSSSEELFFPWVQNAKIAKELDDLCKKAGIAVMGTGVNPGFVMDTLPAFLTQAVHTVEAIQVERVVNASTRRLPLQKKIGTGLDEHTFRSMADAGRIGHVGLMESLDFIASYMGWKLDKRLQKVDPVLAKKPMKTHLGALKKDQVCGLHHKAWGEIERKKVIELDLKLYLNAEKPGDHIRIVGNPALSIFVENGTPGDPATVAALIRGVPVALNARSGIVRRLERDYFREE